MSGDLRRFARVHQATRQRAMLQAAGRKRAASQAAAAAQRRANMARLIARARPLVPLAKAALMLHPVGRAISLGWTLASLPLPELTDPYGNPIPAVGGFASPTFVPFTTSNPITGGIDTSGWTRTCFNSNGASNGAFSGFTGCVEGTVILNDGVNRQDQISSTTAGGITTWAFLTGTISSNQAFLPTPQSVRLNRIRENWRKSVTEGDPVANPITPIGRQHPRWPRVFDPIPAPELPGPNPGIRVEGGDVPPQEPHSGPSAMPPVREPRERPFVPWRPRRRPGRGTKELKWLTFSGWQRALFQGFHGLTEVGDFLDGIAYGLPGANLRTLYDPFGQSAAAGSLAERYSKLSTLPEKMEFLWRYAHTLSPTLSLLGVGGETLQDGLIGPLFRSRGRYTGGPPIGMGYGL